MCASNHAFVWSLNTIVWPLLIGLNFWLSGYLTHMIINCIVVLFAHELFTYDSVLFIHKTKFEQKLSVWYANLLLINIMEHEKEL